MKRARFYKLSQLYKTIPKFVFTKQMDIGIGKAQQICEFKSSGILQIYNDSGSDVFIGKFPVPIGSGYRLKSKRSTILRMSPLHKWRVSTGGSGVKLYIIGSVFDKIIDTSEPDPDTVDFDYTFSSVQLYWNDENHHFVDYYS